MALERLHCLAYGWHECRWRYDLCTLDERESGWTKRKAIGLESSKTHNLGPNAQPAFIMHNPRAPLSRHRHKNSYRRWRRYTDVLKSPHIHTTQEPSLPITR